MAAVPTAFVVEAGAVDPADTTPTTAPTVTVTTAAGQADPTNTDPVAFTATFSEPVTGLDATDIDLAAPTGATVTVTPVSASTYTITVSGMTGDGNIAVAIPAAAAINADSQINTASNTTTVSYDATGPVATIDLAAEQAPATTATPVAFSITFDEAVTDFTIDDIAIDGTAGPAGLTLAGTGTTYTATIDQAAEPGTITLTVAPGAATDPLANESTTLITADTVTITDITAPVIATPGSTVYANTDPGQPYATVDYTVAATDPDSTGTVPPTSAAFGADITPTCTPASGSYFFIGTTTVECIATDNDANTTTASFFVDVTDNEAPVISGVWDQSYDLTTGTSGRVSYARPTDGWDNSGNAVQMCAPRSGTIFTAGVHTITCTSEDASGNTTAVEFTVTVNAAVPPTNLPATGNSNLPWKPALILIALGIALLATTRRHRHTTN